MCGILGSVNIPFSEDTLNLIAHRGPDDFGIERFHIGEHNVHFAHRRLSIVDLSPAGHQPMVSACGNYVLIFNGEIYNHQELRHRLPNNLEFKGHSDSETLLYYLIHFGQQGIADLNGIFAFSFADKVKKKMILARDPFGVKPLYYAQKESGLVFSSEIRPIQALLNENELDGQALASLLRLRYNTAPRTLFKNVQKVPSGHIITWDISDSKINHESHFYASKLPKTVKGRKLELVDTYGDILEESVKRQLLSDVEVGVLLSGGIDSALIAALAKKHYKGKLKAFTIGFEGEFEEDEIADAKETAELLGLEHHVEKISFHDFLGLIKECSRIVEEPLATTSMIPMYYLAKLASEHVKVVLTGQGADEPLGGYTRYRSEIIREHLPSPIRSVLKPTFQLLGTKNDQLLRGAKTMEITNEMERFLSVYEIFDKEDIRNLIGEEDILSEDLIGHFYTMLNCKSRIHPTEKLMALDTRLNLSDDLLNYTDKITMNFALECRVPMLDLELVRFMESLPLEQKVNYREGKLIHKAYAKQLLPKKIINRKKKGFQSPTNRWFREEMDTLKSLLLDSSSSFSRVFNLNYVQKILEKHISGYNKEKQIFLFLSIYYWLDSNNKNYKRYDLGNVERS